jgi:hypothetical protein
MIQIKEEENKIAIVSAERAAIMIQIAPALK